jgi:hypothetical protein
MLASDQRSNGGFFNRKIDSIGSDSNSRGLPSTYQWQLLPGDRRFPVLVCLGMYPLGFGIGSDCSYGLGSNLPEVPQHLCTLGAPMNLDPYLAPVKHFAGSRKIICSILGV